MLGPPTGSPHVPTYRELFAGPADAFRSVMIPVVPLGSRRSSDDHSNGALPAVGAARHTPGTGPVARRYKKSPKRTIFTTCRATPGGSSLSTLQVAPQSLLCRSTPVPESVANMRPSVGS